MSETLDISTTESPTWTEQEIRQQPKTWLKALKNLDTQRREIDNFLTPILGHQNVKIILTGAGTSAFIGDMIAPWLARHTELDIVAVPTTDIVSNPMDYFSKDRTTLLVSFARSGNSPESAAAVELANQMIDNAYHLMITCNEAGALYQNACGNSRAYALLMPAETHDRGFAMTSSITTMMASCLAVFAPQTINLASFNAVAERCEQIIHSLGDVHSHPFGNLPFKRIVYLGSGGLQGVARESALKVLELTAGKLAAFYDSPTGFRHGPKSLVDKETLVIVMISSHSYTRLYDLDLLQELRNDNQAMRVIAIAADRDPAIEAGPHFYLPPSRHFHDVEQAFCFLMYAQIFALSESLKAGITPDYPSTNGTVNRVVQGVTIHPWKA